ncbi:MAG: carboxypeptidase regulatory-like domain-containing protein [Candidatus Acidiferrales bacterium]
MKTRLVVLVLAAALPLAIIGCSKKEPGELSERPAPTAVVDPSTTASITGIVKLDGPPPVFRPIDMSAEAACVQANAAPITPPVVVTGPGDALANVVVYVKSGLGAYHFDTPQDPAVLDQKGCMYDPRVLAFMVNQPFEVKNTDPATHNVHPMAHVNRSWNRSLDAGEAPYVTTFSKPELAIPVVCNIHPWMRAFVFVFADPYFAVTPKSGAFELKNLPPGTYTIEAWHERFGTQDETVTVAPHESKSIAFTFRSSSH